MEEVMEIGTTSCFTFKSKLKGFFKLSIEIQL
jgi:hypothetical protein